VTPILIICILLIPTTAFLSSAFASWMRSRSLGQQIRTIGPEGHAKKTGTPTMGGAVVLAAWLAGTIALWRVYPPTLRSGFILASGFLFGAIGAADDLVSIRKRRSLGLSPPQKIALSSLVVVILFFGFNAVFKAPVRIPFSSHLLTLPPIGSFFLAWFVFLATTNGMNLTDGLDGLATGVTILILIGAAVLSPTRESLAVILPLIAVLVGFGWANAHPSLLFLGDVGSFSLGGIVAGIAMTSGTTLILPILGGIIVLETGSVILQVAWFRVTGKRLFKMSPLHHHFERETKAKGEYLIPAPEWSETAITTRFLIVEALFVLFAILAGR